MDKSAHADKENMMKNMQQFLFMSFQTSVFGITMGDHKGRSKSVKDPPGPTNGCLLVDVNVVFCMANRRCECVY